MTLPSEVDDRATERIIRSAGRAFVRDRRKIDTVYEHGHWWLIVHTPSGERRTFSVVDASGPGTIDGFDFEEV